MEDGDGPRIGGGRTGERVSGHERDTAETNGRAGEHRPERSTADRPTWREPGMPGLLLTTGLAFAGFAVLMPVAPMHVVALGGDTFLAGLVNAVLMAATVLTQLVVERVRSRIGWSAMLVLGCLLLGLPALAEIAAGETWQVVALAAVRGVGFGIITVSGSSAVAALIEPARRGRAIGVYGLAIAVSQFVLTPVAPWIAENAGFPTALAMAALPIVAVPFAVSAGRAIERHLRDAARPGAVVDAGAAETGMVSEARAEAGVRTDAASRSAATGAASETGLAGAAGAASAGPDTTRRALARLVAPIVALTAVTCSGGAIMTFAPQFAGDATLTFVALLVFTGTASVARWIAGGLADRHGARAFIAPALGVAVLGLAGIAVSVSGIAGAGGGALVVVGALLVGTSFGFMQNVTLVRAFELAGEHAKGTASTAWNVAFDAGTGLGSLAIGAIVTGTSFAFAFALLAVACLVVAVALLLSRR